MFTSLRKSNEDSGFIVTQESLQNLFSFTLLHNMNQLRILQSVRQLKLHTLIKSYLQKAFRSLSFISLFFFVTIATSNFPTEPESS